MTSVSEVDAFLIARGTWIECTCWRLLRSAMTKREKRKRLRPLGSFTKDIITAIPWSVARSESRYDRQGKQNVCSTSLWGWIVGVVFRCGCPAVFTEALDTGAITDLPTAESTERSTSMLLQELPSKCLMIDTLSYKKKQYFLRCALKKVIFPAYSQDLRRSLTAC